MITKNTTRKTAKKTTKAKSKWVTKRRVKHANKMSALDAAAKVLAETERAMTTKEMIEAMGAMGIDLKNRFSLCRAPRRRCEIIEKARPGR